MEDLINKAKCYLNGDLNYTDGISVFIQLTRNKHLVKHLSGKHTAMRERKLKYELGKIIKHHDKANKKENSSLRPGTIQPDTNNADLKRHLQEGRIQTKNHYRRADPSADHSDNSHSISVISKLEAERREQYRQRGHEHGRLHETISDANRKEIALRILDIQSRIDQLNRELKDARNGKLPSRFIKQSISAEQYIEIKNLKYYIARYKRELEKVESISRKEKLQQLIDQNQQKLNKLL